MNRLFPVVLLTAAIVLTIPSLGSGDDLTPDDHIHYYSPMLGVWKMTIKVGGVTLHGTAHWSLGANKKCLLIDSSDESGTSGQSIQGFDPRTNTWQMAWFDKDGNFTQGTLDPVDFKPGETISVGPLGIWKDLFVKDNEVQPTTAKVSCKEVNDDRVVFEWKAITPDGNDGEVTTIIHDRIPDSPNSSSLSGSHDKSSPDYEQLKQLEWLIGEWEGVITIPDGIPEIHPAGAKVKSRQKYFWMQNKSYIGFSFREEVNGRVGHEGFEIVGVDPETKKLVHWIFSTAGGNGAGEWSFDGKVWHLNWWGLLPNNTRLEGVSNMVSVDRDTHTWEIVNLKRDDKLLANYPRVTFRRVKTAHDSKDVVPPADTNGQGNATQDLDYFVGSWIWEGQTRLNGQLPEAFVWRHDSKRTLDGRFLLDEQCDMLEGLKTKHVALIGLNGEDDTIRAWGFWAPPGGPHEEVVYTKTDTGWRITREGLDGTVTIIDKDNWKYEADFERNGTKNHWGFTARRLKSPTKADAKKAIDSLVGQWSLSFEEDGKVKTAKVTATRSTSEMALRITYQEPGEEPANGMFAWHATKKQVVETWFRNGEHVRICFDGLTEDGALIGAGGGGLEGKQFRGVRILKFHSRDQYTHTIRGTVEEGELQPEVVITANRL